MFTCLVAVAALSLANLSVISSTAGQVEADARGLTALVNGPTAGDPAFMGKLDQFSAESLALSAALREAGLTEDLPCIFKGIGEDAKVRGAEIQATNGEARTMALAGLAALLRDAAEIAPTAAREVSDRVREAEAAH